MRTWKYIALSLLVSFSGFAQAQQTNAGGRHSAEAALSNDTLQLRYVGGGEMVDVADSRVSAAFFLSEERDIVLSADILFPANLRLGPATILFGPRAYAALLEDENSDVMSMSLGTEIRLDLNRRSGLALVGHAFYGPDILTFGSADSLTDLSARAELRVAPRLTAFGGMRWFEFDLTEGGGERTLQEELFAGFGWRF
jgi:hypothetical protein